MLKRFATLLGFPMIAACTSSGVLAGGGRWVGPLPSSRDLRTAMAAAKARLDTAVGREDADAMGSAFTADAWLVDESDTLRGPDAFRRYLGRSTTSMHRASVAFRPGVVDYCTDGALERGGTLLVVGPGRDSAPDILERAYSARWVVDVTGLAKIRELALTRATDTRAPRIAGCDVPLDQVRFARRRVRLDFGSPIAGSTLRTVGSFNRVLASRGYQDPGPAPSLRVRGFALTTDDPTWGWARVAVRVSGPLWAAALAGLRSQSSVVVGYRAADSSYVSLWQDARWVALTLGVEHRNLHVAAGPLAVRSTWLIRESAIHFTSDGLEFRGTRGEARWTGWATGVIVDAGLIWPVGSFAFVGLEAHWRTALARIRDTPHLAASRVNVGGSVAGLTFGIAL